ncbi:MAG: hypothetical protein ACXQS8_07445, partial [Candidatus Helarchaeales archaeon]
WRKPEIVKIKIRDDKNKDKIFELHPIRRKYGVLGKPFEYPLDKVLALAKIGGGFYPWIVSVLDHDEMVFPYFHGDTSKVILSPTFFIVKNLEYEPDKIDPYNVELAGFLFVNNPRTRKNYLEAVSGSVVGNISVIEKLMKRTGEPYTRENHLQNWLAYLLHPDSNGKIIIQCFNMQLRFLEKYKLYINKIA